MLINLNSEDRVSGTNSAPVFDLSSLGIHRTRGGGKLEVRTVEIPYTFYILTNGINNRFRYVDSNLSNYTIYLGSLVSPNEGSPNITTLIANLKAQLDINSDGAVWTITLDSTRGKLKFRSTKSATFEDIDPETFQVLGIDLPNSGQWTIPMATDTYSDYPVNLSPIRFVYVRSNLPLKTGHDWESYNKTNTDILCKMPLNASPFTNIYYEPQTTESHQCSSLTTQFQFRLTDRKNRALDLNNIPWSITLDYDLSQ